MISDSNPTLLITGVAGLIGYHTAKLLLQNGYSLIGVDNLVGDCELKKQRLSDLGVNLSIPFENRITQYNADDFSFFQDDIRDPNFWKLVNEKFRIEQVLHLAVSPSSLVDMDSPMHFAVNQFNGFIQVLDFCVKSKKTRLYYSHVLDLTHTSVPINELFTLDNSIQWMNDHWATVYWELYQLQSMALEFPLVYDADLSDAVLKTEGFLKNAVERKNVKRMVCHASIISSFLVMLIKDTETAFTEIVCPVAVDYWKEIN